MGKVIAYQGAISFQVNESVFGFNEAAIYGSGVSFGDLIGETIEAQLVSMRPAVSMEDDLEVILNYI